MDISVIYKNVFRLPEEENLLSGLLQSLDMTFGLWE